MTQKDTPVFTFVDNALFTPNNAVLMNAIPKNKVLDPKCHTWEMSILQNGTEQPDLEFSVVKSIVCAFKFIILVWKWFQSIKLPFHFLMIIFFLQKYHAGGPDSPAYWEKSVTLGCRKFYFDNFKKRYHILVVNNGLSLSLFLSFLWLLVFPFSNAKHICRVQ